MPGRVHDVDLGLAPTDGRVLRENRDAPLALEGIRVHHALRHLLVGAENARLTEHLVDQAGLAVVDVGDDTDVADCQGIAS